MESNIHGTKNSRTQRSATENGKVVKKSAGPSPSSLSSSSHQTKGKNAIGMLTKPKPPSGDALQKEKKFVQDENILDESKNKKKRSKMLVVPPKSELVSVEMIANEADANSYRSYNVKAERSNSPKQKKDLSDDSSTRAR